MKNYFNFNKLNMQQIHINFTVITINRKVALGKFNFLIHNFVDISLSKDLMKQYYGGSVINIKNMLQIQSFDFAIIKREHLIIIINMIIMLLTKIVSFNNFCSSFNYYFNLKLFD